MTILVTGAAGFIGMHVSEALLARGETVVGIDSLNAYYDVGLKRDRLARLEGREGFTFHKVDLKDREAFNEVMAGAGEISGIIHLAAQAGVRHSLTHPFDYTDANVTGFLTLLEYCRHLETRPHFVYASSSSVYGANNQLPYSVDQATDRPVSLYAATKKANELMAYTYAHLYGLRLTGLRFFTVYGPWGRPDMSAWLFTDAILKGRPIRVFNEGRMRRDFTYVDDIAQGVVAALDTPPTSAGGGAGDDGVPHRVFNLGNNAPVALGDFIRAIETATGREAVKILEPMQPGDVPATYADIDRARSLLDFAPRTPITTGIPRFVAWFRDYHRI